MNEMLSVHYKIMIMTMVRNEGGKGKGKGQRKARNSCNLMAAGLPITAAEATAIHCFQLFGGWFSSLYITSGFCFRCPLLPIAL